MQISDTTCMFSTHELVELDPEELLALQGSLRRQIRERGPVGWKYSRLWDQLTQVNKVLAEQLADLGERDSA